MSRLRVGDIIFTSRDGGGGRIGGDVVSYVEYAIVAVYEDAEKNSSYLLQAFRRPSQYVQYTDDEKTFVGWRT